MPSKPARQPTAAFIVIGDEILSGRTTDKNLNWLASHLHELGIRLVEARVIGDDREQIASTVRSLSELYDVVFTSGGIGPTHDDITTECVAEAFGATVILHPEADRRLVEHYKGTNLEYNDARRKMAHIPEGAELIDNPSSVAPGFILGNVFVLPGVPSILRAMVETLDDALPGGVKSHRLSVRTNVGEGAVAEGLGVIQSKHSGISIGSYPWFKPGAFGTALVVSGLDKALVEQVADEVLGLVQSLGGKGTIEPVVPVSDSGG